jgi:hypothetical protein
MANEAWRELSRAEREALLPFTIRCADLDAKAVRKVRETWHAMAYGAFFAFAKELSRVPDERESAMLAAAIVRHLNAHVVPLLAERGRVTLQ